MILIVIFIILIIILIAEIFRYNRIKANAFSEAEVTRAAEEQARKIKYKDPIITCRYCGATIDTGTDKVCRQCGGPYDDNPEWTERHEIKDSFIEEGTAAVIAKREKKAQGETERIMKRIRKEIMAICLIMLFMIIMAAFGYYLYDHHRYQGNEDVNTDQYRNFVPADYQIQGDGVIYDKGGVRITVTGIYVSECADSGVYEDELRCTKVGFHVENRHGKNVSIAMKCSGVNGILKQRSDIYTYDYFRKHADVTFYEELPRSPKDPVSEMIFDYIEVNTIDYDYCGRIDKPVYLHTTVDRKDTVDFSDKKKIYSDHGIDIYAAFLREKYMFGYKLYIVNNSDIDFSLNNLELRIDGTPVNIEKLQNAALPKGYTFETDRIRSYQQELPDMIGKNSQISVSFVDNETHLRDFSTGFMDVSELSK